jgi:hypothetical protein
MDRSGMNKAFTRENEGDEDIHRAIAAGAMGYLLKDTLPDDLYRIDVFGEHPLLALRSTNRGCTYNVNGQIFHVYGGIVSVLNHPLPWRTIYKPGMWTLDELTAHQGLDPAIRVAYVGGEDARFVSVVGWLWIAWRTSDWQGAGVGAPAHRGCKPAPRADGPSGCTRRTATSWTRR